jgi:hypothetical protein
MTVLPEQSGGQNSAYRSGCHKFSLRPRCVLIVSSGVSPKNNLQDASGCRIHTPFRIQTIPDQEVTMMADNKEITRRVFEEIWNKKKLNVVDDLMAADYVHHDPQSPDIPKGIEGYKQFVSY